MKRIIQYTKQICLLLTLVAVGTQSSLFSMFRHKDWFNHDTPLVPKTDHALNSQKNAFQAIGNYFKDSQLGQFFSYAVVPFCSKHRTPLLIATAALSLGAMVWWWHKKETAASEKRFNAELARVNVLVDAGIQKIKTQQWEQEQANAGEETNYILWPRPDNLQVPVTQVLNASQSVKDTRSSLQE